MDFGWNLRGIVDNNFSDESGKLNVAIGTELILGIAYAFTAIPTFCLQPITSN